MGDLLTNLTLKLILNPIFTPLTGSYVYPTIVPGVIYGQMPITAIGNGTTLTVTTLNSHFFQVGASVALSATALFNGTYTILSVPTPTTFTCASTVTGAVSSGTVTSAVLQTSRSTPDYFSTLNLNLWASSPVNQTSSVSLTVSTFTTPAALGLAPGQTITLSAMGIFNGTYTVATSSGTTFTVTDPNATSQYFTMVNSTGTAASTIGRTWYPNRFQGSTWKAITIDGPNQFLLIVGSGGYTAYSTFNSTNWTMNPIRVFSGSYKTPLNCVAVAYGLYSGTNTWIVTGRNVSTGHALLYRSFDAGDTSWTLVTALAASTPTGLAYGNGYFVLSMTGKFSYSSDGGATFVNAVTLAGAWTAVAYGTSSNFVMVGSDGSLAYSSTNGTSWTPVTSIAATWSAVAYGNGYFVACSLDGNFIYSSNNGNTWSAKVAVPGSWSSITYGNGLFVAGGGGGFAAVSTNNGATWTTYSSPGTTWTGIAYRQSVTTGYVTSNPITVSYNSTQNNFAFNSGIYTSIYFSNSADAAFWGFDYKQGLSYSFAGGTLQAPWTLQQGGWISGYTPAYSSQYVNSVANNLINEARITIGGQTFLRYSGEYLSVSNDYKTKYENIPALTLFCGTNDTSQSTTPRQYYVNMPMGTDNIPMNALDRSDYMLEVDFNNYNKLSGNLNLGTGDFYDPKSYNTFTGGLNGSVLATVSSLQYSAVLTSDGYISVYNKGVLLNRLLQSTTFVYLCLLGDDLFIELSSANFVSGSFSELVAGNVSSFTINHYTPATGTAVGGMVTNGRYVYYAQLSGGSINLIRYDTTLLAYTSYTFVSPISGDAITTVRKLIVNSEYVLLIGDSPSYLYKHYFNSSFSTWFAINYPLTAGTINDGIFVPNNFYLISNNEYITVYDGTTFTTSSPLGYGSAVVGCSSNTLVDGSTFASSFTEGNSWFTPSVPPSGRCDLVGYLNGYFLSISNATRSVFISSDFGVTWTLNSVLIPSSPSGDWSIAEIAGGNNVFVVVDNLGYVTVTDSKGTSWSNPFKPYGGSVSGTGIKFYNGFFYLLYNSAVKSTDFTYILQSPDGINWTIFINNANSADDRFNCLAISGNSIVIAGSNYVPTTGLIRSWNDGGVTPTNTNLGNGAGWVSAAVGNGLFVLCQKDQFAYATVANPGSWTLVSVTGFWNYVTYANSRFLAAGGDNQIAYSTDGATWTSTIIQGNWKGLAFGANYPVGISTPGSPITNLTAVGTTIYASAASSVIQINTVGGVSTKMHSVIRGTSPFTIASATPSGFTYDSRYVYIYNSTNIIQYDPYAQTATLAATVLADFIDGPKQTGAVKYFEQVTYLQNTYFTDMGIKNHLKEIWIKNVTSNTTTLSVNGEYVVSPDVGLSTFLKIINPFETHTSMPTLGTSQIPFDPKPELGRPNGTINFSRLPKQQLSAGSGAWFNTCNILILKDGVAGLMFNS